MFFIIKMIFGVLIIGILYWSGFDIKQCFGIGIAITLANIVFRAEDKLIRKKPKWLHRKMCKLLLGWDWKDSKNEVPNETANSK